MKTAFSLAAAATLAVALPAAAQPRSGPAPTEQVGMFIGDTSANGSATIVTDRTGTHPDGYTGMATQNHASAASASSHRHHHHRSSAAEPSPN